MVLFMAKSKLLELLKSRRKSLGMTQEDMTLRVGMGRQQYQRLESGGNPRLNTLELLAKGLKMEVMQIPQEKVRAVKELLTAKLRVSACVEDTDYRHGRGSTLIASQLPAEHWHEYIGSATLADAILDRLLHGAHRLTLKGESMRKTVATETAKVDGT